MAISYAGPLLAADFLAPAKASFDVVGSAVSGGRNGYGQSQSIELSGGGLLKATYEDCKLVHPEQFEYVNWLGARLNGGFRFINVPIPTEWYGPFPKLGGKPVTFARARHSDGASFSDTSSYSQATVYGEVAEDATLNAGILKIRVYGLSRPLRWSDWFSIQHVNKGWRAYRYWEVLDKTYEDAPVYTLALTPPLREAVSAGQRIEFARPRFAAKFDVDFTLPNVIEAFGVTQQSISFVEAF